MYFMMEEIEPFGTKVLAIQNVTYDEEHIGELARMYPELIYFEAELVPEMASTKDSDRMAAIQIATIRLTDADYEYVAARKELLELFPEKRN